MVFSTSNENVGEKGGDGARYTSMGLGIYENTVGQDRDGVFTLNVEYLLMPCFYFEMSVYKNSRHLSDIFQFVV